MSLEQEFRNPLELRFEEEVEELTIYYRHPHIVTPAEDREMQIELWELFSRRFPESQVSLEDISHDQQSGSEVIRTTVIRVNGEDPISPHLLEFLQEDRTLLPAMTRSLRARMDQPPLLTGWRREVLNHAIGELHKGIRQE